MSVFLKAEYNYDTDAESNLHGLECKDPSRAIQSQKEEADIHTIVKRFGLSGEMPQSIRIPSYGDFTGVSDYRQAIEAVKLANDAFMSLPAAIRVQFSNSPEAFVEFCSNPANTDKMIEMGLLKRADAEPKDLSEAKQTQTPPF